MKKEILMHFYITILLFFILNNSLLAQSANTTELLKELNVTKITIDAFEHNDDGIINHQRHEESINKHGLTSSFCTTKGSKFNENCKYYTFSDDFKTKKSVLLNKNNDTLYHYVQITNTSSYQSIQLNSDRDTLHSQIWYQNKNGLDSLLKRRTKNNQYVNQISWTYNSDGEIEVETYYNKEGDYSYKEEFFYEKDRNCVKKLNKGGIQLSNICIFKNRKESHFVKDRQGYLYGIKLESRKGGKRIEYYLENGLVDKIEYVSEQGQILSKIKFSYKYDRA